MCNKYFLNTSYIICFDFGLCCKQLAVENSGKLFGSLFEWWRRASYTWLTRCTKMFKLPEVLMINLVMIFQTPFWNVERSYQRCDLILWQCCYCLLFYGYREMIDLYRAFLAVDILCDRTIVFHTGIHFTEPEWRIRVFETLASAIKLNHRILEISFLFDESVMHYAPSQN